MRTKFNKRIYNISNFKQAVDDLSNHIADLRSAHREKRIDKAFSERIMLAVTQVNDCRYCIYSHTHAALAAGVPPEEIQYLIEGDLDKLPEQEIVAIFFAQHYAETGGNPDPEAWQRVTGAYGPDKARDIMAYIRMITMGNLLGNTLDAFLSRLAFNPAPNSSLFQELGVLLGLIFIIPGSMIRHSFSREARDSA